MHEFLLISKYLCDFSIAIIEFHLSAILLKVVIYVIIMFILIFFFVSLILIFLFYRSRMDLRVGKIWLSQFSVLWERSRSMPWRTLAPSKRLFAWSRMQIAESCGKVDSSVAYWCPVSRWMSSFHIKWLLPYY